MVNQEIKIFYLDFLKILHLTGYKIYLNIKFSIFFLINQNEKIFYIQILRIFISGIFTDKKFLQQMKITKN